MRDAMLGSWLKRFSQSLRAGACRPAASARFRRPWLRLELLEDRVVPSVSIAATNNNGQGYAALDFNQSGGYVPPDTVGAAGPTNYVETVNQTVALYSPKASGAAATTSSLSTFWFTTGGLARADSGSGLSDPIVVYNDQIGRFIVGDQDVNFNTHVSAFDVADGRADEAGMRDAAEASWEIWDPHEIGSGAVAEWEMGRVWAEKREIFYVTSLHKPLDNFTYVLHSLSTLREAGG